MVLLLGSWSPIKFALCTGRPPAYNQRVSEAFRHPIDAATRYCAVYGQPIRHSASPALQNAGLAALGLNWRYLAFEVPPAELRTAIAGAKAMRFVGLNLTVPHKLLALDLVDALDESARAWGAVNTIRFEAQDQAGVWQPLPVLPEKLSSPIRSLGFNTDAEGLARALREDLGLDPRGLRILLLGAGGAGRMAALKLAADGAKQLFLINRTRSKAETIAAEMRQRYPAVEVVVGYPEPGTTVDLLLNATSLGLNAGDEAPWDEREFSLSRTGKVYDMIYRPAETPLLRAARAAGCQVANGLGMLLHQGARAQELWTGRTAPLDVMRDALHRSVYGA